ncbi:heat shock protein beta-1-like [Scleropages formosus]|uniref:Heat shock protein, alpha-crystallin-related, b15 n=1 Tax=Scleropages formosus TaxID=113540 RepID=A0A8C9S1W2_SCLFO|nr:heat shock protein beta-1-like [Scleropages formosus]
MAEHRKVPPRPLFRRDVNWDPFRDWAQPSRIFDQDFGLPPFLEPGDLSWIDWARRRMSTSSWPGYTRAPLFAPTDAAARPSPPSPQLCLQIRGVSEIRTGPDSWKIGLDVSHFSPEEITIRTKEGYLEIAGKHEERQDEHGFVSRCFTRKYKLPPGVDLQHISSSLSRDGVLAVEAPLPPPAPVLPTEIVIPIQVEEEEAAPIHSKRRPDKREKAEVGKETSPSVREWKEGSMAGEEKPQT